MRLLWTAVSALAIALLAPPDARADGCIRVATKIVTTFYVAGCRSPLRICTKGTVDSGPLKGATNFEALTMAQGPEVDVIIYEGSLVLETRMGRVVIRDFGALNGATGAYSEIHEIIGGTNAFRNATGTLLSKGTSTGTGFAGTLEGSICRGRREHRDDDSDADSAG